MPTRAPALGAAAAAWRARTQHASTSVSWSAAWTRGLSTAAAEEEEASGGANAAPPSSSSSARTPRLPVAMVTLPTSLQDALMRAATGGGASASAAPPIGPRVGGPPPSTPTRRAAGRLLKRDAAALAADLKAAARSTGRGGSLALPWAAQGVVLGDEKDDDGGLASPSEEDEEGDDEDENSDWSSNDGDDEGETTPWSSSSDDDGEDAPSSSLLVPRLGGGALDLVAAARMKKSRHQVESKPRLSYGPRQAAAYAASRAPATFAAATHALSALAAARPGWVPASALDFGSGPGVAAWAARGVWRDDRNGEVEPLASVVAVERSPAMAAVGRAVAEALADENEGEDGEEGGPAAAFASAASPPRFIPALPGGGGARRTGRHSRPPRPPSSPAPPLPTYDLVIAAYALGEVSLGEAAARAPPPPPPRGRCKPASPATRLALDLWARVSPAGALLLLEPGTPGGSALIRAARAGVLEEAGGEAHVAAPCPHDGRCPLEDEAGGGATPGAAAPSPPPPIRWCHFRQRYARPPLTRAVAAAMKPGGRGKAAGHADERFAYVALVKGGRAGQAGAPGEEPAAPSSPPRLVRPPRRRRGHVLLDVCAAGGGFDRVTVTVAGGKEAYKAARGAAWGGVWGGR